jgi:lambda repressor-like predicted transcriptional regulator
MDKKQKEALVMALLEKGATYREITKEAGVSPNTIKAVLNKAGLNESTSISSRAFELYVQQKTPVEVAITLNIEAKEAIRYYHEYFMLLGITEFTKVYLQINDNPMVFVNLFKLSQNARIGEGGVVELLKIANGHLPRVRLEYDRVKDELNSCRAELSNTVQIYQQFCDRNLEMNKRINELQLIVDSLEAKRAELQKTTTPPDQHPSEFQETSSDQEMEKEISRVMNELSTPPPNMADSDHHNENEISLGRVDYIQ